MKNLRTLFTIVCTILIVVFYIPVPTLGQTPDSSLNTNIHVWNKYASRRNPDLFLHLDKSLYTPNENILFTAYLLDKGSDTATQNILYIVLIDLAARKVITSDRFVMNEGISSGALFIPDTLESGQYLVTAYTNGMRDGPVKSFFRQEINIRSREKQAFNLAVSISPNNPAKEDSIPLTCKIETDYKGVASGGAFNYSIFGDGRLLQSGKKIVDPFGEVHISLPPLDTVMYSVILNTEIKRGDKIARLRTPLILRPQKIVVSYYPEGGSLVAGHTSRMGIDIRKTNGIGISTSGELREDGEIAAYFQTNAYGFGFFDYKPLKNKKYEIQLPGFFPDTYVCGELPLIRPEGLSLHIANPTVRDSLTLTIQGPISGSKCILMIYSDHALLYTAQIRLNTDKGNLVLPVKDWPKGIAEVVLFTGDGKLVAERAIFLPAPRISVTISMDSSLYHPRSRVQVHVKVTDEQGNGIMGLFSMGAVRSTRINTARLPDIGRNAYFDHYVQPDLAPIPPFDYFENDSSIETMLLTRFWKQLSWEEITGDTVVAPVLPPVTDDYGHLIIYDGKKIRKPVPLFLMGPSMYSFETDSSGHFRIPYQALLAPLGTNPLLSVMDKKNQADYNIIIQNHYDTVNKKLAEVWYSPLSIAKDTSTQEEEENNTAFNSVKTLKSVVVRAGGNKDDYQGSESCRDWVCLNNVLNCPNHPFGTRPKIGETYMYIDKTMGPFARPSTIVYRECISCKGCNSSSFIGTVRAIHLTPEFYKTDSANFSPTEPAIYSTLYWAPLVVTDKNGETTFRFYTNDLKGKFYILVQGISTAGVFSGKQIVAVRP